MKKRCTTVASDARRCCRPEHEPAVKHLLGPAVLGAADAEAAIRIANAWGWRSRMAASIVSGALSAGPISTDRFVQMLATTAGAFEMFK